MRLLLIAFLLTASAGGMQVAAQQFAVIRRIDSLCGEDDRLRRLEAGDSVSRARAQMERGQLCSVIRDFLLRKGYPGLKQAGSDGCERFWLLLQHAESDPALQRMAMLLIKPEVDSGNVPGLHYAFLQDRLLVNSGELQRYGTQVRIKPDSSGFEPRPVQEPALLDQRRAALGLPPIAEYIRLMNSRYKELLKPKERKVL